MKREQNNIVAVLVLAACQFAASLLSVGAANAQVVISAGVQEIYDDNIFLENDNGTPPPVVLDDALDDPSLVIDPPVQVNGDPDDDLITNVFLGFSSPLAFSPHVKSAAEGKVGALIFADNTDESRLTVDAVFTLGSEKTLIPDPYYIDFRSALKSRSSDVTAADGTASKQAQELATSLNLGARGIDLSPKTKLGLGYSFTYTDFLGEWTFNDREEEVENSSFNNRIEARGSDYFTNSVDSTIENDVTDRLKAGIYLGVTDYVFTNVESNDLEEAEDENLDRTEGNAGLRSTYQISEQVSLGGSAGLNYSHLKDDPEDLIVLIINEDGSQTTVVTDQDQNDTSFIFGANVNYAPDTASLIRLAIDQSRRTDLDGDRLITRTVTLDMSKGFGDRFKIAAGGRFLQYNIGDSISDPTDRLEATASIQYNITESIAVMAGYNYANQDADEANLEQRFLFASEDYEVHRAFIGLTAGLVGTKS